MTELIAYQGIAGAFGEEAVNRLWRAHGIAVPAATFADALDAVQHGATHWAVIPVWNAIVGPIRGACVELHDRRAVLQTIRHVDVEVGLCLLALPGARLCEIRYVGSHPAALGQCGQFFARHPHLARCEAADTASAASEIAQLNRSARPFGNNAWFAGVSFESANSLAAVASRRAAREYGLAILVENIQDARTNFTRFVAVRRRAGVNRA